MQVKTYKPQNPLLRNHIECFYTLTRKADENDDVYLAFPNVFTIISLHRQTKIESSDNLTTLSHCAEIGTESRLICHIKRLARIRYRGKADEISIYFKPLGLNAFLARDLRHYVQNELSEFDPFEDFRSTISEIFSLENPLARIRLLENYWLSKLIGFQHPFLPQIVNEMLKNDSSISLSEAAQKIEISRTTLVKHFDSHLCTTPSYFKKIARFRNAMKQRRRNSANESLTAVSYSAEYFDQSHMIKDFRALTSFAPKPFFSNISTLENGQINWMFL